MESYSAGKGRVISQDNYTRSCQIRNQNYNSCGELGHFARNWPTKRRSNGVQLKPKNQQKCNWGQGAITGIWTEGSIVSNFKASESSYSLHSSEVCSSWVSDSSKFSSSSSRYKSEAQYMKEIKDMEEMLTSRCAASSVAQKAQKISGESLQIPVGTDVDSFSQIIEQVSEATGDPEKCHKAVQTMHNLSVLLLINSSVSDNLNDSDLQTLHSVISNLSLCIMKSTGVSKSTDVAAFMPDKQLGAPNSGKTEEDCYAAEEKEDPVGARSFQIPAEIYPSQMVNIEMELNSIKSEIRSLRWELKMKSVKEADAGTRENGDDETLANGNDINNGSCSELNLVMKENDLNYTFKERSHCLADLNLDPIMGDESFIDECYIKKYVNNGISQNNTSEEPIQKINLNNIAYDPDQANAKVKTKQIEDHFTVLQKPRSCSDSDIEYIRDYAGNNLAGDGEMTEYPTKIGPSIGHNLEENSCLESDSTWEEVNFSEEDHN